MTSRSCSSLFLFNDCLGSRCNHSEHSNATFCTFCRFPQALPRVLADAGVQAGATAGQLVLALRLHQLKPQVCSNLPGFLVEKWTFSSTSSWAGTIHRCCFSLAGKEEASDKGQMKQGGCTRHPMEALARGHCGAGDDGPCLARGARSRGITSSRAAHLRNSLGTEALFSILLGLVAKESWGFSVLCVEIWLSFEELSLLAASPIFGWPLAELPFTSGALA